LAKWSALNVVIFQEIMIKFNGAEPEEDRIVAITIIVLKLMKQN
jgi:hypothetical protein